MIIMIMIIMIMIIMVMVIMIMIIMSIIMITISVMVIVMMIIIIIIIIVMIIVTINCYDRRSRDDARRSLASALASAADVRQLGSSVASHPPSRVTEPSLCFARGPLASRTRRAIAIPFSDSAADANVCRSKCPPSDFKHGS